MRARIHTAFQNNPALSAQVERLLARPDFASFVRFADCNSAEEGEAWMNLADQGGRFNRISHARLGWNRGPIVDASGTVCLTGRLWPVLFFEQPRPLVFFPQVRIKNRNSRIRLDMNVALGGDMRSEFFGVEINGPGHRGDDDANRPSKAGIPIVALTTRDIRSERLVELILERYDGLPGRAGPA